ncbi:SDR family NAD(P)-dependent oxidoreductase [Deinococcus soli (ex Cha et al. 2016)]|uniref:SDR family NAD(P)-dependent oxidoreductase n=1 Tax=Deinococcus soli (ex Cha et al. 2016) TaxID=1309411 RepID=UPI00166C7725|nr:SDR family NAD(P)-dependent oxidoreductase [Deinococcus soli (ex Cha et al. 2016)]GGB60622.1 beta-ketoacyl-ACP reductase [Deinococcus soli (ex Cha et al. 2016)]
MTEPTRVVITGGSNGIGRALVEHFARKGAQVTFTYHTDEASARHVQDTLTREGHAVTCEALDVTSSAQLQRFATALSDRHAALDALINNAGVSDNTPFSAYDRKDWQDSLNSNFFGAVELSHHLEAPLRRAQGSIINMSSIRGLTEHGRAGVMAYSAAKAALLNFTTTLAKELAPHVRVNAIAPGFVDTRMLRASPPDRLEHFKQGALIKRLVTCEEITQAAEFLFTCRAVTGQTLVVDGGYTLGN